MSIAQTIKRVSQACVQLVRIVLPMGYIWITLFYIFLALCGWATLRIDWLAACVLGGWMLSHAYGAWLKHSTPPAATPQLYIEEAAPLRLREHIRQAGWAERMHWVLALGLLGLTWWAMLGGLRLLFKPERWGINFTLLFSLLIVGVMLWLLMMITLKRHYWRYVVLYILFDLFSAFSFNFVHFYENISYTQRLDASMKLCEGYIDYQSPAIDALVAHAGRGLGALREAEREEQRVRSTKMESKREEIADHELRIQSLEKRLQDSGITPLEAERLQQEYSLAKRRQTLRIRELDHLRTATATPEKGTQLQDSAEVHQLKNLRSQLRRLAQRYANTPKEFTPEQLDSAKGAVLTLQALLEQPHFAATLESLSHRVRTDTISYSIWRIQKREQDHFASIAALMRALDSYISPSSAGEIASLQPGQYERSVWHRFLAEEATFEQRLLLLSIMLSMLVDLLPLALAVLVRQGKGNLALA